jgi:hypothetical protein
MDDDILIRAFPFPLGGNMKDQEKEPETKPAEIDVNVSLDFDLDLERVPFSITNKKTGITKSYFMQALDGKDRDTYLQEVHVTHLKNGVVTDHRGLTTCLLKYGIFTEEGKTVSTEEMQTWPSKQLDRLWAKLRIISGLDQVEAKEEAEKK